MTDSAAAQIRFDRDGLVPVVVQDAVSGDVLMLASMNEEALQLTYATREAHYWSRSRQRLWRKGESSGHTQAVEEVRINCERTSLLVLVRQTGAVCHDGYPTCYYRRLAEDGALSVVRERAFDPAVIYGNESRHDSRDSAAAQDRLAQAMRRQFGAYAYLRDNDLAAESATSRRLRDAGADFRGRVGDELRELAGVLDGAHRHSDSASDLRLEASQVLYWVIVEALRRGVTWAELRPDTAMAAAELRSNRRDIARLLTAEADCWNSSDPAGEFAANARAALALVAMACRSGGLDPLEAVEADLNDLRTRPYLTGYFGREGADHGRDATRARVGAG